MPPDDPGKLSEDDYVGLVSYILQANGYPAGSANLEGGALSGIQLVPKPGEERELRSFSVVQVVGCLSQGSDRSWVLTRASDPSLTRDRAFERRGAAARGRQAARRADVPAGQRVAVPARMRTPGRKIEVKGLLYKSPDQESRQRELAAGRGQL